MDLPWRPRFLGHEYRRTVVFAVLVGGGILGLLVVDALNYLTETIELGGWARWLSFDDGRLATLLMGALSTGVALASFRLAGRKSVDIDGLPGRAVWATFGLGCLVIGALDVADIEPGIAEEALLGLAPLVAGALIARGLRGRGLAFWLMAAGLLLILFSPAIGVVENHLLTDPNNYTPGAPGQPYPFIHRAWVELWWVSRTQELAELGAMACFLLALISLPGSREAHT